MQLISVPSKCPSWDASSLALPALAVRINTNNVDTPLARGTVMRAIDALVCLKTNLVSKCVLDVVPNGALTAVATFCVNASGLVCSIGAARKACAITNRRSTLTFIFVDKCAVFEFDEPSFCNTGEGSWGVDAVGSFRAVNKFFFALVNVFTSSGITASAPAFVTNAQVRAGAWNVNANGIIIARALRTVVDQDLVADTSLAARMKVAWRTVTASVVGTTDLGDWVARGAWVFRSSGGWISRVDVGGAVESISFKAFATFACVGPVGDVA
jgi:hypothetical protein